MRPLTPKRLATILADRCADRYTAYRWQRHRTYPHRGVYYDAVNVSGVGPRPDGGHGFRMTMERLSRGETEVVWAAYVEVTPELDIVVEKTVGEVPESLHEYLACAFED